MPILYATPLFSKTGEDWSKKEDQLLRDLYPTHTRKEIAQILNRSKGSVRARCWTLGLNTKHADEWTEEEIAELKHYYQATKVLRLDALEQRFKRHRTNIARKARQLGLTDKKRIRCEQRKDRRKFRTQAEYKEHLSARTKERWATRGHPRGMLGKKHPPEAIQRISETSKQRAAEYGEEKRREIARKATMTKLQKYGTGNPAFRGQNAYSRCKRGKRADLGDIFFRSAWEANYARFLNLLKERGKIVEWVYEPETFVFHGVTRGALTYTPDFLVEYPDGRKVYHEVKGWLTSQAKTKIRRFRTFYPQHELRIIDRECYRIVEEVKHLIPNWE